MHGAVVLVVELVLVVLVELVEIVEVLLVALDEVLLESVVLVVELTSPGGPAWQWLWSP